MGMDFISAGWTTDNSATVDEEAVRTYIDGLSDFALLTQVDRLDDSSARGWDPHYGDDLLLIEEGHDDLDAVRENKQIAEKMRDCLRAGAEVALDSDARMFNSWGILGTPLVFNLMGGGSWGDDPFEGYTDLVMFVEALYLWPDLRALTGVVCGGLPSATVIAGFVTDEEEN